MNEWTEMTWQEQVQYLEDRIEELEKGYIDIMTYNLIRRYLDMKYRILIMNQ